MAVRFLVVLLMLTTFCAISVAEGVGCCQGDECSDCRSICDHHAVLPSLTLNHRNTASTFICSETLGGDRIAVADVFRPPSS